VISDRDIGVPFSSEMRQNPDSVAFTVLADTQLSRAASAAAHRSWTPEPSLAHLSHVRHGSAWSDLHITGRPRGPSCSATAR